jgi:two-component system sensor histidine kinase HydH
VIGLFQSMFWLRNERRDWPLIVLFLFLSPMQLLDAFTLIGVIRPEHEIYYMRLYTPFIALSFGYCIWMRWLEREKISEATLRAGEVAASVAHDLKSPVASLRVVIQGLSESDFDRELIGLLSFAVDRIEKVSSGLLSTYRGNDIGSTKIESENGLVEFVLMDLVEELLAVKCLESGNPKAVVLRCKDSDLKSKRCFGDKTQLMRALDNLINNALEASIDSLDSVIVDVFNSGVNLVIEVSDSGSGMHESLIRRFNNQEFGTTTKASGSGIGLAYVWRVARYHEGDLKFRINSRGGISATFTMPIRDFRVERAKY